jgi:GNAT superfamily N-acetyltransferase
VRFGTRGVASGLNEVRSLMRARGRRAAAWSVGPSATPADVVSELVALGLERESATGSTILVLTHEPDALPSTFDVRPVATFEEHLAAIEVANEAAGLHEADALDDLRRARETFEAERSGDHAARLVAFDGRRPVATGRAEFAAQGVYLGGGATIPSHRRRGAMSSLIASAWVEAVRRGTPVLVTSGGDMSTSPLRRLGFTAVGRIDRLIDRLER